MLIKLYCYVDETGQDTGGKFFLVAIVVKESKELDSLEGKLEAIEERSGKRQLKWKKIKHEVKKKYLEEILKLPELRQAIFYSVYENTKAFSSLTSLTIAKAILAKENKNYTATVIIDGLNDKEREKVGNDLKKLKIKYRKIRGMKDEKSIFLRLADAMAGFLREVKEKESYTKPFMKKLTDAGIVLET